MVLRFRNMNRTVGLTFPPKMATVNQDCRRLALRSNLRNLFLEKLSYLLAKHRALDYLFWGIPDAKREGDGFQPPYSVNKLNIIIW